MFHRRILFPAVLLLCLSLAVPVRAAIWRVDADAPGPAHNGETWASAFLTVQAALDAATDGDEVWVAQGVYAEHVTVTKSVALYGGFSGTETERDQRNIAANPTVLDGGGTGTIVTCTGAEVVLVGCPRARRSKTGAKTRRPASCMP